MNIRAAAQQHESCSDTWPRAAEHNLSSVSDLVDTFYCRQLAAALQHSVCSFLFRQEYFKQILCVQRGRVDEWYCLKLQYSSSSNKCKSRKTNPLVTASATGKFMSVVRWSQSVLVAVPHSSHQLPALACCDQCPSLWRVWQLVLTTQISSHRIRWQTLTENGNGNYTYLHNVNDSDLYHYKGTVFFGLR